MCFCDCFYYLIFCMAYSRFCSFRCFECTNANGWVATCDALSLSMVLTFRCLLWICFILSSLNKFQQYFGISLASPQLDYIQFNECVAFSIRCCNQVSCSIRLRCSILKWFFQFYEMSWTKLFERTKEEKSYKHKISIQVY